MEIDRVILGRVSADLLIGRKQWRREGEDRRRIGRFRAEPSARTVTDEGVTARPDGARVLLALPLSRGRRGHNACRTANPRGLRSGSPLRACGDIGSGVLRLRACTPLSARVISATSLPFSIRVGAMPPSRAITHCEANSGRPSMMKGISSLVTPASNSCAPRSTSADAVHRNGASPAHSRTCHCSGSPPFSAGARKTLPSYFGPMRAKTVSTARFGALRANAYSPAPGRKDNPSRRAISKKVKVENVDTWPLRGAIYHHAPRN
jgi:hypothetical protein